MQLNEFLKLAGVGAVITTAGSLFALFIKDFYLTRYFENRKERKLLDDVYKRYKDPITLSSIELSSRLIEIHQDYPTVFLTEKVMKSKTTSFIKTTTDDEHFRRHKLLSTIYRLCSFFGWLELYRQEITFLNGSNSEKNRKIEKCLLNIRSAFADGHLNNADDWNLWKDYLIFREEQREIGESMITVNNMTSSIIGYAKFKSLISEFIETGKNDWLNPVFNFFINPNLNKDFRKNRYFLLIGYFQELLAVLDEKQSEKALIKINTYLENSQKNYC